MKSEQDSTHDETCIRILNAAGEIFAEAGYQAATVRKICTLAGTNVASVNYHFGDKFGLYVEVLRRAVSVAEARDWRAIGDSVPPQEVLRMFIRFAFRNFQRADRPGWQLKLMMHELAQPTPALQQVVDELIRPNFLRVSELVGRIIGRPADHPKTRMCAFSMMGQVIFYVHARPVLKNLWPDMKMDEHLIDQVSTHIADFTLAALEAVAKENLRPKAKQPPRLSKRR